MANILFLCTGNSARSIMAECYMNHVAKGYRAYSAGSQPTGTPNPLSLKTLRAHGIEAATGDKLGPSSKSWDAFAEQGAPIMDIVVTVCDNAAGEVCPIWPTAPGKPAPKKLHWSFEDPAAATGSEEQQLAEFTRIFSQIRARIDDFVSEQQS